MIYSTVQYSSKQKHNAYPYSSQFFWPIAYLSNMYFQNIWRLLGAVSILLCRNERKEAVRN